MFKAPRCKQICTNEVLDNIAVPWSFLGGMSGSAKKLETSRIIWCQYHLCLTTNDIKEKLKQTFHLPTPEYQQSTSKSWYVFVHSLSTFHPSIPLLPQKTKPSISLSTGKPPSCVVLTDLLMHGSSYVVYHPDVQQHQWGQSDLANWVGPLWFRCKVAADIWVCIHPEQRTKNKKNSKRQLFKGKKSTPNDVRKILCVCVLNLIPFVYLFV